MIVNANQIDDGSVLECDLCIVGGGVAGITLAKELASTGRTIFLMESGPASGSDGATHALGDGKNVGLPYFRVGDLQHRGLGGNSVRWSSFVAPFDEIDFESRSWVPDSGWPFPKSTLEDYYRKASPLTGVGPYSFDATAMAATVGREDFKPLATDPSRCTTRMFQFRHPPLNWGEAYTSEIEKFANVQIFTFANCVRIGLNEALNAVSHLQFKTTTGKAFGVKSGTVVLAMGGVETPRVMLASVGSNGVAVGNRHDVVGRYFMEHPHYTGVADLLVTTSSGDYPALYTWEAIGNHNMVATIGPSAKRQKELGILNCAALFLNRNQPFASAEFADGFTSHLRAVLDDSLSFAERVARNRKFAHLTGARQYRRDLLEFRIQFEQAPNPLSRVTLSEEVDALGLPKPLLDWRMSDLDSHSRDAALRLLAEECGRIGLGRVHLADLSEYAGGSLPFKAKSGPTVFGAWHYMGTTRMHADPERGVVDVNCRVHGLSNLYIAGPSVFPTGSFANPVMTLVALALRLADHLRSLGRTPAP